MAIVTGEVFTSGGIAGYIETASKWCASIFKGPPPVSGQMVEWSLKNSVYKEAVANSTPLPSVLVNLVVQYLMKNDQIGQAELETLYGKAIVPLFANETVALPQSVDCEMQLAYPYWKQKRITEVMSLIYVPQKMTANIARKLGEMQGIEIEEDALSKRAFLELGDQQGDADAWYLVSHDQMHGTLDMYESEVEKAVRARGFEWVSFRVLLFTIFTEYAWTGKKSAVGSYGSCQELVGGGCRISLSFQKSGKLAIVDDMHDIYNIGPILMKRLC